jgi:branched-chain amino acid transport system substrate-binding protein
MKQFSERGLDKSGIRIIEPGDVMDGDLINAAFDTVTAHERSRIRADPIRGA